MDTPGITMRPIRSDRRRPRGQPGVLRRRARAGLAAGSATKGEGWTIAKYLLEFERGGSITRATCAPRFESACSGSRRRRRCGDGSVLDDADLALAFSTVEIDIDALEMTELRVMSSLQAGQNPGGVSSLLKLRWSEIEQAITRLGVRLLGPDALIWETTRPLYADGADAGARRRGAAGRAEVPEHASVHDLRRRIEIQREIISREVIG